MIFEKKKFRLQVEVKQVDRAVPRPPMVKNNDIKLQQVTACNRMVRVISNPSCDYQQETISVFLIILV